MTTPSLEDIAAGLQQIVDEVFDLLHEGASRVVDVYEASAPAAAVEPVQLHALRPTIRATMARVPAFQGTGFVADPAGLRGVPRYEEWWHRGADGDLRFLDLDMNPNSANTYNYVEMPYFVGARTSGDTVAGPYLDFAGSDLYILTFASPVHVKGVFVGVSAADMPVGEFERLAARHLLQGSAPVVLVNADDRVVGSSAAAFAPGDRVPTLPDDAPRVGGPGVGWRVGFAPAV